MNKIDLNGRCAVVTGGAQGFGRAIAERFVASGAKVAIWDHDLPFAEKTAKEIGPGVTAFKVDVSDLAAVEKTRDETLKALGKIDILVNNAGIAGVNKTVWETDLDEWRKVLRINLDGPFICCKAVVPAMLAQKYGRIVNISSAAGVVKAAPNRYVYAATKAAVAALTRSVAADFVGRGIRCNCICPGTIETPSMLQRATAAGPGGRDMFVSRQPMGRLGTAEEIASLAVYLASDESAFTTGVAHIIDGGWTL